MKKPSRIIIHHYVNDAESPLPGLKGPSLMDFKNKVELLAREYNIVSLGDYLNNPVPEGLAVLTFDDGLASHYRLVYPFLKSAGLPATFFVSVGPLVDGGLLAVHKIHILMSRFPSLELINHFGKTLPSALEAEAERRYRFDFKEDAVFKYLINYFLKPAEKEEAVERLFADLCPDRREIESGFYMTSDQIKKMSADGFEIQSHGYNHHRLSSLGLDDQEADLRNARERLQTLAGNRVEILAYPYGKLTDFNEETIAAAKKSGYRFGVMSAPSSSRDPFRVGRIDFKEA